MVIEAELRVSCGGQQMHEEGLEDGYSFPSVPTGSGSSQDGFSERSA